MSQLAPIQGNLNFGSTPNIGSADLGYGQAYSNALSLNQQNYGNILQGYQQTLAGQQQGQQGIQQGYGQLQQNVLGTIHGIAGSQQQAISDVYAQQSGQAAQSLTSRGLGNTTVSDSVQRGLLLDKEKANVALSNQTAALTAGYQSQLGQAGLNYQNQALMQNSAQANQQLGWMNSVQSGYPQAAPYMQALQQQGYLRQAMLGQNQARQAAAVPRPGGVAVSVARMPALNSPDVNYGASSAPGIPYAPNLMTNSAPNQLTAQAAAAQRNAQAGYQQAAAPEEGGGDWGYDAAGGGGGYGGGDAADGGGSWDE